jgi:hypothetical protein
LLGSLKAGPDTELVGRLAEQRLELPDKVKRRHRRLARDSSDRYRLVVNLAQQVSRTAQTGEATLCQHGETFIAEP